MQYMHAHYMILLYEPSPVAVGLSEDVATVDGPLMVQ